VDWRPLLLRITRAPSWVDTVSPSELKILLISQRHEVMLVGIIVQMVALTLYIVLAAEFMFRFIKDRPFKRPNEETIRGAYMLDGNMKTLIWSMTFGTVLLYIRYVVPLHDHFTSLTGITSRSIYRVVELTDGWNGKSEVPDYEQSVHSLISSQSSPPKSTSSFLMVS
jgi:hypothetical protein